MLLTRMTPPVASGQVPEAHQSALGCSTVTGAAAGHQGRGGRPPRPVGTVARVDTVYTTRAAHVPSQTAPGSAPLPGRPRRPTLPRQPPLPGGPWTPEGEVKLRDWLLAQPSTSPR